MNIGRIDDALCRRHGDRQPALAYGYSRLRNVGAAFLDGGQMFSCCKPENICTRSTW